MTNSELFYSYLDAKGLKLIYLSNQLGISRQSMLNKAQNKTEFKASEIAALRRLMGLSEDEMIEIFFA